MHKHEGERFTLYRGDAAEALELIEPKSVGLLASDPPYGVKWQSGFRKQAFKPIANDDGSYDAIAVIGAYMQRVLASCRHIYVFGSRKEELQERLPVGSACDLMWDKCQIGPGDLELPWGPQHEPIAFAMYVPSKANRERGTGSLSARLRQGSVLSVQRPNSRGVKRHPTEKPVELMRRIIESSSVIDDVVLDPFAGSGSTLVAAILSGRKAIGVEIDEGYFDVAVERCKKAEVLWKAGLEV